MENPDDRELLELAAKACGNGAQWDCPERGMMVLAPSGIDTMTWDPRNDPGQAFALLVALQLELSPIEGGGWDVVRYSPGDRFPEVLANDYSKDDQLEAACRAIVRAAAELGRRMP